MKMVVGMMDRRYHLLHITCLRLSYILLLTAFYVDNGKNLPPPKFPGAVISRRT
jgi:hypothetical protein